MESERPIHSCAPQDNQEANNLPGNPANSSSSQISNGSHYYYRGVSQPSPAFNPLLPTQTQSLYNGVFPSQSTFPNQNTFGYNGYSFVDHPTWVSDNRIGVPNNSQTGETTRTKNIYTDKSSSLPQGISHSCCTNRMLEHTPLCSPLLLDQFKASSKEINGCQTKGVSNVESQTWFYGTGLIGFSNQQNLNVDTSHFKRNDDFPPCPVNQIGSSPSENIDMRQPPNIPVSNSFSSGNQYSSKGVTNCEGISKTNGLELNKEGIEKYFNVTKLRPNGHVVEQLQQKHLDDHGSIFNTPLEEVLYSHAPLLFHVNNESNQNKIGVHGSFQAKTQSYIHNNVEDLNKTFPSGPDQLSMSHFQNQSRCSLETTMQCEIIDSCLSSECKPVGGNSGNAQDNSHSSTDSCQLPLSSNSLLASDAQSIFANQHFPQRQGLQCLQTCSVDMCINSSACQNIDEEDKENSNHDSSSVACESDIIVEETGGEEEAVEDITESESADMVENPGMKCMVCSVSCSTHLSKVRLVQMNDETPLTSTSQVPLIKKVEQVIAHDFQLAKMQLAFICRRCINLINVIDNLESKLASAKHDIIQLFNNRGEDEVKWVGDPKIFPIEVNNHTQIEIESSSIEIENSEITTDSNVNHKYETTKSFNSEPNGDSDTVGLSVPQPLEEITKKVTNIEDDDTLNMCDIDIEQNCEIEEQNFGKNKFNCKVCAKSFSSLEYLNIHKQQHTQQFSYYCDRCGQGFSLRRGLENHLFTHRGEFRFQCEICGKGFIQRHSLDDHLRRHEGTFRFNCQQCSRGFMHRSALRIHMRTHTGERPYMCEHCGRPFSSVSNLRAHKHICLGERPYQCNKCDKKFALKAQLTVHTRFHEGQFCCKCEICGRGFVKEFDYKVHLRSHTGERPHKCSICGKCYSSIGNLNQHAKMHSKEKPHKCSLCDKGFLRKTLLAAHMNQHTGEKPYKCSQCDKCFSSSRNLLSHAKGHTQIGKRYMCTVCGKSINHSLQVHMRTHSGHKPYKCAHCDMAFTVKSTLNKHIKSKHKECK